MFNLCKILYRTLSDNVINPSDPHRWKLFTRWNEFHYFNRNKRFNSIDHRQPSWRLTRQRQKAKHEGNFKGRNDSRLGRGKDERHVVRRWNFWWVGQRTTMNCLQPLNVLIREAEKRGIKGTMGQRVFVKHVGPWKIVQLRDVEKRTREILQNVSLFPWNVYIELWKTFSFFAAVTPWWNWAEVELQYPARMEINKRNLDVHCCKDHQGVTSDEIAQLFLLFLWLED